MTIITRHKKFFFILLNALLFISSAAVVCWIGWDVIVDIYFAIDSLISGNGLVFATVLGFPFYFVGFIFLGAMLSLNIIMIIRVINNFKNKCITDKSYSFFKFDSWLCLLEALTYVASDMFRIFALFYVVKLIILRVLVSKLFYSEYGRKKIKDTNKSDESKITR